MNSDWLLFTSVILASAMVGCWVEEAEGAPVIELNAFVIS